MNAATVLRAPAMVRWARLIPPCQPVRLATAVRSSRVEQTQLRTTRRTLRSQLQQFQVPAGLSGLRPIPPEQFQSTLRREWRTGYLAPVLLRRPALQPAVCIPV